MDQLEFQLEQIDGGTFEDLAMAFLRAEGYSIHESGRPGADGGWDARIGPDGRAGIAHASTENRWKQKLRSDAESVADLEAEQGEDYDIFVFVTNQKVTGAQELDIEGEIQREYSWKLKLYRRANLIGEIRQNSPDLANQYLDIDLGTDHDLLREIEHLRDDRVKKIQARSDDSQVLPDGPAIALHVIPYGIFTQQPVRSAPDIPDPAILDRFYCNPKSRGQYKIGYGRASTGDERGSYGLQQNDGLFESVSTEMIYMNPNTGDGWLSNRYSDRGLGLDIGTVLTTQRTLRGLEDMGFSGSALASISLIDAGHVKLKPAGADGFFDQPALGTDIYSTLLYPIPIAQQGAISNIEEMLSEIWRELGHESGTPSIENGKWKGGPISIGGETLIENGDE